MPSLPISLPLRWADLRGTAVGVWGVGVEGRATLSRLEQLGVEPAVVVDDRPPSDLGRPVLETGPASLEQLGRCEVVIKSPGISRYRDDVTVLEEAGVAVVGGLGLWLETHGPEGVIGFTGTKGKSTTTSVAGHLASGLGIACAVGGNIGLVPWDPAAPQGVDLWVIEVSSYQATDLWSSPAVVGVTSLHPDHILWHGTVERYYDDKLSLCGRPGARITIANGTDERLRSRAAQLAPGPVWVDDPDEAGGWAGSLGLRGRHNLLNAAIAARCLVAAGVPGAGDGERLATAAAGYHPLPHRLETVAVVGGVEYVDDSLSTNVLPAIAAAEVFEGRPLVLIAGGQERNIDYEPLGRYVVGRPAPTLVLTLPDNGPRITAAVTGCGGEAQDCADLAEAVRRAARWAPAGGVVLLSPAAASFGRFGSYKERGEAFRTLVASLGSAGGG
ncbi:MAG TPA: UDP-N-acetylmuramoyl-L-alanine--D-glutamate ligase [Acidimicrobiales bacterium]|nr:UDP-N-acetylmuramoyl-L-alanine--D-glutamate ligase [Acidimicrobiales bacterium]